MGTGEKGIPGRLIRRLALAWAASAVGAWAVAAPASAAVSINLDQPGFVEGTAFTGEVATFTDDATKSPSCDPTAYKTAITWGDGSSGSSGTVSVGPAVNGNCSFAIKGSHTYAEEGAYKVTVAVTSQSASASGQWTVADAALSSSAGSITATSQAAFNGTVASFTDGNPLATPNDFTATIEWGDGTSSLGTVTGGNSSFVVQGSHTWNAAGSYPVKVVIADTGGSSTTANTTANVGATQPPAPNAFTVSPAAPNTGQPVLFDASRYAGAGHGGVRDYAFDLNGDGTFERDLHRFARVSIVYNGPGTYNVGLRVTYVDGTVSTFHQTTTVTGPTGACTAGSAYCSATFPPSQVPGGSSGCRGELTFGPVDAISQGPCFRAVSGSTTVFTASGPIRVNGIDITPLNGATITIDESGGTLTVSDAHLQAGELVLGEGALHWTGLTGSGPVTVSDPVGPTSNFEGFPFSGRGRLILENNRTAGYRTRIDAFILLPQFFGNQSADIQVGTNNAEGVSLTGLHVAIGTGNAFNVLHFDNLHFDYDEVSDTWGGGLELKIADLTVNTNISFVNGNLDQFSAQVGGLNVQLGWGFNLDNFTFGFSGASHSVTGGIGVIWGPKVDNVSLIEIDGQLTFFFTQPPDIQIQADLKLLSVELARGVIDFRFDGDFALAVELRVPWYEDGQAPPNVRLDGGISGFIDGPTGLFSVQGDVEACLFVCVGAHAVGSSVGVAACVQFIGEVGGAYTWADHRMHFPIGCDLAPYTVARPPAAGSARDAAVGERDFFLRRGMKLGGVRVFGTTGPPLVRLVGPRGQSITTPSGAVGVKNGRFWLVKMNDDKSTGIAIARPAGGVWRIVPLPGSPTIAKVETADSLPPVRIAAHVAGTGLDRRLVYSVKPIPGQKVAFAEESRGVAHAIGTARSSRGSLRFLPSYGRTLDRKVVAIVTENGMPRTQLTVAHYRAPGEPFLRAPAHLKLRRRGTSVVISWKSTRGATGYAVRFTTVNRRLQFFRVGPKARRFTVGDVPVGDPAKVTVAALDRRGIAGHGATARLRR